MTEHSTATGLSSRMTEAAKVVDSVEAETLVEGLEA